MRKWLRELRHNSLTRVGMNEQSIVSFISTPAFVLSQSCLVQAADRIATACRRASCCALYSVKALSVARVLECLNDYVDGFSVCSPNELRLVRDTLGSDKPLHMTSPYMRIEEIEPMLRSTDYVTFNSLRHFQQHVPRLQAVASCGLRINPNLSFVADQRYDPCRNQSKLGVPIDELTAMRSDLGFGRLSNAGLHFHTNCEGREFGHLLRTVSLIAERCKPIMDEAAWINVGGGYLFNSADRLDDFVAAVELLRSRYKLEVFIEPGAGFVREAGTLVSTVVDLFSRDEREIAVLDTTVNHWPEVFEYEFEPDVEGHVDEGRFTYLLAGCSCLAGDLFGVFSFNQPLEVGSRVVFHNAGAYSIAKASMFNGINLPNIYILTEAGDLVLVKQSAYEDFASQCGVDTRAIV